jgi:hypothetical protein
MQLEAGNLSGNNLVGFLLEESSLGLTKLVEEIYEKLKGAEGVSEASVRSSVLLIGQRMMYGKSSPDADVLDDESESALWCWEVKSCYFMTWCMFNSVRLYLAKKSCFFKSWTDKRSETVAGENTRCPQYMESCQKENS